LTQGATAIHGSTHKSMFGPQKGLLVFRCGDQIFDSVEGALHPILASNIHLDHIAGLAGTFEELIEGFRTLVHVNLLGHVRDEKRLEASLLRIAS
jgi:glycine/serine hydroxymethyltransferase